VIPVFENMLAELEIDVLIFALRADMKSVREALTSKMMSYLN